MSKKVVLITGASSGIGKTTAKDLAQKGFTVYGVARNVAKMNDLKEFGVNVLEMDVTNEQSMVNGINQIFEKEVRIDVLINNAGFGSYGSVEEVPMSEVKYQMEVNLFGAARVTQLVLPKMIENHYGKIVNISSIGGKIASPLGGWYHASKFALEALSDSLRNEVRQFGVDVIVVEPGGIKTEWGSIATNNMLKVSGQGRYKQMAENFANMLNSVDENSGSEPKLIADVIYEAITTEEPETRYAAGFMAKELLDMRKNMSDKEFDNASLSQLGF
ncbi:short-chain dehydrogenase/reductase [Labilibaculum manganireducens]|uniref:Short-chain dehydrogenase/reductase n=1 Tax=Labilibaculum manganireducens TaxID=1940525 RepID=A0A2N3HRQ1_9BACT|nr:oxidoreductase [Labilibaculum manganireducens]PKQ60734.1 short-chain dehydrogenase/reductase [Labilibaculum manganireducens]